MDEGPVMSAYPDEQEKLDKDLADEVAMLQKVVALLDEYGFEMRLSLRGGLPDLSFVKK